MRIPHVSLRPQIGDAELRMDHAGHPRFDDFPETAEAKDCHDRKIVEEPTTKRHGQPEQFLDGIGQKKPETKVDDAIVLIPPERHRILQPRSRRNPRVSVSYTDRMQAQEHRDQDVGGR